MSSAAAEGAAVAGPPRDRDQFVVLHGVPWRTYCAMRELLDIPGVRMTYLRGALEIRSPSRAHEVQETLRPYVPAERSELVPGLDFAELVELAEQSDQHAALKQYRALLRSR